MKNPFAVTATLALATLFGCNQGQPGGPGTTSPAPTFGQADNTFNLSVPVMSSTLQQGTDTEATIGIKRAKNFDDDVTLSLDNVPAGVMVEPASPVIHRGDTEARVTFKAGNDAPLGDFQIKVKGHPTEGADAQVEFKLTITAKDSFTLSLPRLATPLAQGGTQTVTVGITRDKTFDQVVELTFSEPPTGVTIEPRVMVLNPGDQEAQVTLTAAEDAALGSFTIKVTGHPAQGADIANAFDITVAKR